MKTNNKGLRAVTALCIFAGLLLSVAELSGQEIPAVSIDLTVRNFKFSEKTLTVPAGARVTVRFSNRDDGIPHNFALYTDNTASQPIYKGEVIIGTEKTEYTFTAPADAGNYYFRCDIHPVQMNGTFIVKAGR